MAALSKDFYDSSFMLRLTDNKMTSVPMSNGDHYEGSPQNVYCQEKLHKTYSVHAKKWLGFLVHVHSRNLFCLV